MTLLGGRDFPLDSPSSSDTRLSPGILSRGLRLHLHRRDHRGRSFWKLVDTETQSNPLLRKLHACTESRMNSEMQTSNLGSQFMAGAQDKVPARKRGRPPTRKLEFHYPDSLSSLKVPKKRGRKPGFKLKPRMVMSPLANSAPSSTPEPEAGSIPHDAAIIPHSAAPQALAAETAVPDEFTCDPLADSKRYAVDPSDSAFKVMTSQYQTKRPYGYRPSLGVRRQASSPASFQDGNRNVYSAMPDSGEAKRLADKDPSSWGVEEVVSFIKEADPQALAPHADTFRKHEIDGDALLLLKSEMMMKYLGLKLGPALKLCYHIDKLKQGR